MYFDNQCTTKVLYICRYFVLRVSNQSPSQFFKIVVFLVNGVIAVQQAIEKFAFSRMM